MTSSHQDWYWDKIDIIICYVNGLSEDLSGEEVESKFGKWEKVTYMYIANKRKRVGNIF